MKNSLSDKELRVIALERVAAATREKVEPQTYALYLEDTARVETRVFVEACRRLERSLTWFPKVKELLDECSVVARWHREQQQIKRLPAADEPDLERKQMWLERIKAACQGHRMP